MFSLWERQSFLSSDVIIVGGGILGLSTACSIKERNPNTGVMVLERGILPTGASTKNAGFACFGSLTELVADSASLGQQPMLELVEKRWRGLALLDQRLGEEAMEYEHLGGFELLMEEQLTVHKHIDEVNQLLFPIFQMEVFHSAPSKITEFGFNKSIIKDIIFNPFEGQIDTGKMMKALIRKTMSLGAEIITGAEVTALHSRADGADVVVSSGGSEIVFRSAHAVVCTNALLPQLAPQMNVQPGRGQVVVTAPIPNLKPKGAFHFDEGFYYFRNYHDRILFGGGRNLDIEAETTAEFSTNNKIVDDLKEKLTNIILPGISFTVEHHWQGVMGFGASKLPVIDSSVPNISAALGCNGMGVALSSLLAEELAEKILSEKNN